MTQKPVHPAPTGRLEGDSPYFMPSCFFCYRLVGPLVLQFSEPLYVYFCWAFATAGIEDLDPQQLGSASQFLAENIGALPRPTAWVVVTRSAEILGREKGTG